MPPRGRPSVGEIRKRELEPRRYRRIPSKYVADEDYMRGAVKDTARVLRESGQRHVDEIARKAVKGYKRGGKVRRTGLARLHRGERVLTKAQARKYARRKRGRRK